MVAAESRPLVVCEASGAPTDVVLETDKGYKKTIESGTLWALHGDTGRLLPYAEGRSATIEDRGTWYRAVMDAEADAPARSKPAGTISPTQGIGAKEDANATMGGDLGTVLSALAEVIRDRRKKMPEGSYTTHLFSAGSEKVRKKTGEEAVELILSSSREEMTSEAADLLYHLLVLLEYEGIPLDAVAAELSRR